MDAAINNKNKKVLPENSYVSYINTKKDRSFYCAFFPLIKSSCDCPQHVPCYFTLNINYSMCCLTFYYQLKRWDIKLDIAAPQIILPEKFVCENTSMIVMDLGHIRFHNTPSSSPESRASATTSTTTTTEGIDGIITVLCNYSFN